MTGGIRAAAALPAAALIVAGAAAHGQVEIVNGDFEADEITKAGPHSGAPNWMAVTSETLTGWRVQKGIHHVYLNANGNAPFGAGQDSGDGKHYIALGRNAADWIGRCRNHQCANAAIAQHSECGTNTGVRGNGRQICPLSRKMSSTPNRKSSYYRIRFVRTYN